MRIAAFVSPHGFGHAARAVAILSSLAARDPALEVDIYTLVPEWFFRTSLPSSTPIHYHALECDVGFEQRTPVEEDIPKTIERLSNLYPLDSLEVATIGAGLRERGIQLVLCDISALGIAAAEIAKVPSVLVENFTWDFIYADYVSRAPGLEEFVQYLAPMYERATHRIQTVPICVPHPRAATVGPVSRPAVTPARDIRKALSIEDGVPLVMISMGGVVGSFPFLVQLGQVKGVAFVVAGLDPSVSVPANVRAIPHRSSFFHPDLVRAADALVGKAGYSTVAEAYHGRTQFMYVPRARFAESPVMEAFVTHELNGVELSLESYESGEWLEGLMDVISEPPSDSRTVRNG